MHLTAKFKKWLVDNCDVKANADDDEFRKAAGIALADGSLDVEKFHELTTTKEDEETDEFASLLKGISDTLGDLKATISGLKKSEENADGSKDEKLDGSEGENPDDTKGGRHVPTELEKMIGNASTFDSGDSKTSNVRVKDAAEQYSTTKSSMTYPERTKGGRPHPLSGRPVMDYTTGSGKAMDTPSDRDQAIVGAFSKFLCLQAQHRGSKTVAFQLMPQHDKELLCYALENEKWGGATDGGDFADIKDRKLTPKEQKALIDDATSGGTEAAPIVFDDMIIQTPLLNGELFPLVNSIPLDRGRRVEGVATGTVTGSWGGVDDTAVSLFNTGSYVSAFDTTIFRWEGAVTIGLDFLSDTPIDFGRHLTAQYGERLLEDLDDVIATGNGTSQPEGIMNKSGATSVAFGATTSIGNYESLRFGVAKSEHRSAVAASAVFCGTETSYQRARAIPVGASDARRLGGMNYDSYSWMERPYKINESLSNQQIFYAILARYRMYRRRGLTMRTSTEGDTLIRNNEMLMCATARYGGQQERGATIARTTTAPA